MANKKDSYEKWKLSKLKDYPRQQEMFGDLPPEELKALAGHMSRKGQRHPVEILPDGTILAGHQRVKAARLLGWTEILVLVRHDLAAAGTKAQESFFIEDNLVRRHLTPLARARSIRRLLELETRNGKLAGLKKEALKKELAERLNLSLRSVNRYLLVLEAPTAVQQAFDRNEITLVDAGKVATLTQINQAAVAFRIGAGEKAGDIVAEHVANEKQTEWGAVKAYDKLIAFLQREGSAIEGRAEEIGRWRLQRRLPVLRKASNILADLVSYAEQPE